MTVLTGEKQRAGSSEQKKAVRPLGKLAMITSFICLCGSMLACNLPVTPAATQEVPTNGSQTEGVIVAEMNTSTDFLKLLEGVVRDDGSCDNVVLAEAKHIQIDGGSGEILFRYPDDINGESGVLVEVITLDDGRVVVNASRKLHNQITSLAVDALEDAGAIEDYECPRLFIIEELDNEGASYSVGYLYVWSSNGEIQYAFYYDVIP
jgi:hypothetical protein